MAKTFVEVPKIFEKFDGVVIEVVEKGIHDATDDLLRVASLRSPVDEGTLEKSGTSKVIKSGKSIKGIVSFSARNNGYNYALKMDKGNYKLGKKSRSKSSKGVRSKFAKTTMKVGSGYLTDSAEQCADGYREHINSLIGQTVVKAGLRIK
ncbi:hypothetical protein [Clostridium perfringens]|uniref:hypothetical protein n=1 Tax=Clostridium perfringens TaxID=1502 RepID=UPI0034A392A1